ncbi:MAG: YfhO family protein [Eubacterium sp.]|nr:YfhO family protein [Eubacterium sp.]
MTKFYKRLTRYVKDNYVYFSVIAVTYVVLLMSKIICGIIPYGENFPVAGIGFTQVYAEFVNAVDNVKAGNGVGFLDYSQGIVADNFGVRSYTFLYMFMRPWLYIIFLIVPKELYTSIFSFVYDLYFVLAGVFFVNYLIHKKFSKVDKANPKLILAGVAYSLSSYSTAYFIYSGFRYMIFIPLVFLGIEKIVYEKKLSAYVLSLFIFMTCDAYNAFILCIFIVLYFILIDFKDIKQFFISGIRLAVASIIAAGLSAFVLIPYYFRTLNSPYESGDSSWPSLLSWFGNIFLPLSDFSPLSGGVITSPQEYRANIYCGLPVLLLLPLYFFVKDVSKSKKIKTIIITIILYLAFNNEFINFVFHGFHHQWQVPNRFACFFIFFAVSMFFDVIKNFDNFSKKKVLLSTVVPSVLLVLSYILASVYSESADVSFKVFIPAFIILFIYVCLACYYAVSKNSKFSKCIFLVIMIFELVVSALGSLRYSMNTKDNTRDLKYSEKMKKFSEVVADINNPFIITERPGTNDNQNIALMTKTNSLSYYTSSSFKQEEDLYYRWGVLYGTNLTYYTNGSPLADMMLHVKYHVTDSEDTYTVSPYPEVAVSSNLILHQNNYALPLGIIMNKNDKLENWNAHSKETDYYDTAFDKENAFSDIFNIGKIYNGIEIKRISDVSEAVDSEKNYYFIEEEVDGSAIFVFLMGKSSTGKVYIQIANAIEYVGEAIEGECNTLYFNAPRPVYNLTKNGVTFAALNENDFKALYNSLAQTVMINVACESREIKGWINSDKNGLLYMAMPNLPGFKAYVDGKEENIINYLDGIGLNVSAGQHEIKLVYTPEGMWLGIVITTLFLLIVCVYGVLYCWRHEKRRVVIKRRIILAWLLIALSPIPVVFAKSTHAAFSNSWFVILVGFISWLLLRKEHVNKQNKKTSNIRILIEIFLTSLFLIMLPIGDVINNDHLISGNLVFQIWKWAYYIPILIYCSWFNIHNIIELYENDIKVKFLERFDLKLSKLNSKGCFALVSIITLCFLFSTYPGYYLQDDVLRVLLRVLENAPSDWDTYGYYLFVKILTFNGKFIYGVNIFQTMVWLLVSYYIIVSFEKWSPKAMRIYTFISIISVVPMFYLEIIYKDTIFAMSMLALTAGMFNVLMKKKIGVGDLLILSAGSIFATLCRKGGFAATFVGIMLITVFLVKHDKKNIRKCLVVLLTHIGLYILIYSILFNLNNVKEVDPYVKYGTPLSMIGAAASEDVDMDTEDVEMLEKVMEVSEWSRCYNRYWVDSIARLWGEIETDKLVKLNDLVENENYGSFIICLNAKLVTEHPVVWFDAFFAMANQIWEISTPYDFVIQNASETPLVGIEQDESIRYTFLYNITNWLTESYADNTLLRTCFYRGGLSLFVIILSSTILIIKKKKKYIMVFVPLIIYLVIMFLAIPAPDARYSLPSIEIGIFTLAAMVGIKNYKEKK